MPAPVNPNRSLLDSQQILQRAFDESADKIRTDATITGSFTGDIHSEIDAADGDNIAIADQSGSNYLNINADGSINVTPLDSPGSILNEYNEVNSVASGSLTTVISYSVVSLGYLQRAIVSGTNIATYEVLINGSPLSKKRTWFNGSLNEEFDFVGQSKSGISLSIGDVVSITVIHNRPSPGDFNGSLQIMES